jgi:TetR/AcrR family transcriptional regulator
MARPRAADYDDKRLAILRRSAQLFAEQGFDRTSMSEIAVALGVSKALFYHYYRAKDDLLFDIIQSHLVELVVATEAADDPSLAPERRLHQVISAILDCYRDADAEHKIQINHLGQLAPAQQAELKELERRLVDVMAGVVSALNPGLSRSAVKPLTMSIFGTLNWKYMWFREGGSVSREEYAAMAARMFAGGIRAVG